MKRVARIARNFLILGRISNLPTVWSDCLTAALLSRITPGIGLVGLCAGASLLYTGGMFLNDAFDTGFDQAHRPERPIPAGKISRTATFLSGAVLLLGGTFLLLVFHAALFPSLLLAGMIVLYDTVHKRTVTAPLIMAACRLLLVLAVASAGNFVDSHAFPAYATALFLYVSGLSFLAWGESTGSKPAWWPLLLIAAAVSVVIWRGAPAPVPLLALLLWTIFSLRHLPAGRPVGHAVGGLLAGIVLLDWFASGIPPETGLSMIFPALFLLSCFLQQRIPST